MKHNPKKEEKKEDEEEHFVRNVFLLMVVSLLTKVRLNCLTSKKNTAKNAP